MQAGPRPQLQLCCQRVSNNLGTDLPVERVRRLDFKNLRVVFPRVRDSRRPAMHALDIPTVGRQREPTIVFVSPGVVQTADVRAPGAGEALRSRISDRIISCLSVP
jgi:hypothetical protein